jgi:hypothetical protein
MTAMELMDQLTALDVRLFMDGDTLRANAPSGVLDETLVDAIKLHKPKLIEMMRAPEQVREDFIEWDAPMQIRYDLIGKKLEVV